MSGQPVSVVVPLYNKAAQIENCLQSILRQTHQALEVIVINDGSTDGSGKAAAALNDPRIRIFDQPNAGVSAARNRGVSEASYEWVFFLDADDEWEPTLVEELLALGQRNPQAGVWACLTELVYADGSKSTVRLENDDFSAGSELLQDYFACFARLGKSPFSNSSFAVRRSVFQQVGGYAPGVRLTEDSDLWVRLAISTPIALLRRPLARYFVETVGNTRTVAQRQKFQVILTLEALLLAQRVPEHQKTSADDLLQFQKLMQIRRHVLLGHRSAAWHALLDLGVWRRRPVACAVALLASITPAYLVTGVRRLKSLGR